MLVNNLIFIIILKVLSPYFGGMIAFVKDTEVQLERMTDRAKISVNERKSIISRFITVNCGRG